VAIFVLRHLIVGFSPAVTPRRQTQHVHPLADVKVLQQNLPAVAKTYGIPVNECLSASLNEHHFFDGTNTQARLNMFRNVMQSKLRPWRNTNGAITRRPFRILRR